VVRIGMVRWIAVGLLIAAASGERVGQKCSPSSLGFLLSPSNMAVLQPSAATSRRSGIVGAKAGRMSLARDEKSALSRMRDTVIAHFLASSLILGAPLSDSYAAVEQPRAAERQTDSQQTAQGRFLIAQDDLGIGDWKDLLKDEPSSSQPAKKAPVAATPATSAAPSAPAAPVAPPPAQAPPKVEEPTQPPKTKPSNEAASTKKFSPSESFKAPDIPKFSVPDNFKAPDMPKFSMPDNFKAPDMKSFGIPKSFEMKIPELKAPASAPAPQEKAESPKVKAKAVAEVEGKTAIKSTPAAKVEEGAPKRSSASAPTPTPADVPKKTESNTASVGTKKSDSSAKPAVSLDSFKAPEIPKVSTEDVLKSLQNVRIPQPGEEVVLPTGGKFKIPTKLEPNQDFLAPPPVDSGARKYNFQNLAEKSQLEIDRENAKKLKAEAEAKAKAEKEAKEKAEAEKKAAAEVARAKERELKAQADKTAAEKRAAKRKQEEERAKAEKPKAAEKASNEAKSGAPPKAAEASKEEKAALEKPKAPVVQDAGMKPKSKAQATAKTSQKPASEEPKKVLSDSEKQALLAQRETAARNAKKELQKAQANLKELQKSEKEAEKLVKEAQAAAEAAKKAACEGQFICIKAITGF